MLGDGAGNFAPHVDFETGNEPRSVAIGDLDGDRIPDLVVANSYFSFLEVGTLSVLRGLGNGDFISNGEYAAGIESAGVTLADWDADGHLDVAMANSGSNTVSVYRNRGDGTFADRLDLGTGVRPTIIAHGDVLMATASRISSPRTPTPPP